MCESTLVPRHFSPARGFWWIFLRKRLCRLRSTLLHSSLPSLNLQVMNYRISDLNVLINPYYGHICTECKLNNKYCNALITNRSLKIYYRNNVKDSPIASVKNKWAKNFATFRNFPVSNLKIKQVWKACRDASYTIDVVTSLG